MYFYFLVSCVNKEKHGRNTEKGLQVVTPYGQALYTPKNTTYVIQGLCYKELPTVIS